MIEAPSRAQRSDPDSPAASAYLWEVPGKPVSVRIPFDVIDRLEREAVDNFRSIDARGSEIGGLLLGSCSPGTPACVSIADYEAIPCDYSRGPLYRLSDADMGRFDAAIERRAAARGLRILGFYRSHTRKGLSFDADDLLFFGSRFRDPQSIALLVRPYATKASTGGIFICEDGQVHGEASYLEFPFQSGRLAPSRNGNSNVSGSGNPAAAPAPRGAAAASPAPVVLKPAVRAQIMPMAARFEIALPDAPLPRAVAPTPEAASPPAPKPAPKPAPVSPPEPMAEEKPPAPPIESVAAPEPAPLPSPTADVAPPAETLQPGLAEPRSRKALLLWGAVAAALLVCSGMLFVYPGILRHTTARPLIPLTLRVEHSAGDLLLTWNRDSDAIRAARHAVLAISDGDRRENIEMNLGDLHNGSIVYSPLTADVSFRMELTGVDQSKVASESVRVLRTRPSPMPEENGKPAQAAAKPDAGAANPATAAASSEAPAEPADTETTPSRPAPSRQFNAASLAQRLRPAQSADLPDAPMVGSPTGAGPVNLSAIASTPSAVAAPVAPVASAPKQLRSSQLQQAQLVSRKSPEYPALARQSGAFGEVRLSATIGADGKVKNVKVLSGHALLQRSAIEAVKQWIYKPAVLNGSVVESETEVVVNFARPR